MRSYMADRNRETTWGYDVLNMSLESTRFMLEFVLSGGAGKIATAAAAKGAKSGALKMVQGAAISLSDDLVSEIAERTGKEMSVDLMQKLAGKMSKEVADSSIDSLSRESAIGVIKLIADSADNKMLDGTARSALMHELGENLLTDKPVETSTLKLVQRAVANSTDEITAQSAETIARNVVGEGVGGLRGAALRNRGDEAMLSLMKYKKGPGGSKEFANVFKGQVLAMPQAVISGGLRTIPGAARPIAQARESRMMAILNDEDTSWTKHLAKAWGDNWVEQASEMTGGLFGTLMAGLGKKASAQLLKRTMLASLVKRAQKHPEVMKWLDRGLGTDEAPGLTRRMGWNGIMEEWSEEVIGNTARQIIPGLEGQEDFWGMGEQMKMIASFALNPMAAGSQVVGLRGETKARYFKQQEQLIKEASADMGIARTQAEVEKVAKSFKESVRALNPKAVKEDGTESSGFGNFIRQAAEWASGERAAKKSMAAYVNQLTGGAVDIAVKKSEQLTDMQLLLAARSAVGGRVWLTDSTEDQRLGVILNEMNVGTVPYEEWTGADKIAMEGHGVKKRSRGSAYKLDFATGKKQRIGPSLIPARGDMQKAAVSKEDVDKLTARFPSVFAAGVSVDGAVPTIDMGETYGAFINSLAGYEVKNPNALTDEDIVAIADTLGARAVVKGERESIEGYLSLVKADYDAGVPLKGMKNGLLALSPSEAQASTYEAELEKRGLKIKGSDLRETGLVDPEALNNLSDETTYYLATPGAYNNKDGVVTSFLPGLVGHMHLAEDSLEYLMGQAVLTENDPEAKMLQLFFDGYSELYTRVQTKIDSLTQLQADSGLTMEEATELAASIAVMSHFTVHPDDTTPTLADDKWQAIKEAFSKFTTAHTGHDALRGREFNLREASQSQLAFTEAGLTQAIPSAYNEIYNGGSKLAKMVRSVTVTKTPITEVYGENSAEVLQALQRSVSSKGFVVEEGVLHLSPDAKYSKDPAQIKKDYLAIKGGGKYEVAFMDEATLDMEITNMVERRIKAQTRAEAAFVKDITLPGYTYSEGKLAFDHLAFEERLKNEGELAVPNLLEEFALARTAAQRDALNRGVSQAAIIAHVPSRKDLMDTLDTYLDKKLKSEEGSKDDKAALERMKLINEVESASLKDLIKKTVADLERLYDAFPGVKDKSQLKQRGGHPVKREMANVLKGIVPKDRTSYSLITGVVDLNNEIYPISKNVDNAVRWWRKPDGKLIFEKGTTPDQEKAVNDFLGKTQMPEKVTTKREALQFFRDSTYIEAIEGAKDEESKEERLALAEEVVKRFAHTLNRDQDVDALLDDEVFLEPDMTVDHDNMKRIDARFGRSIAIELMRVAVNQELHGLEGEAEGSIKAYDSHVDNLIKEVLRETLLPTSEKAWKKQARMYGLEKGEPKVAHFLEVTDGSVYLPWNALLPALYSEETFDQWLVTSDQYTPKDPEKMQVNQVLRSLLGPLLTREQVTNAALYMTNQFEENTLAYDAQRGRLRIQNREIDPQEKEVMESLVNMFPRSEVPEGESAGKYRNVYNKINQRARWIMHALEDTSNTMAPLSPDTVLEVAGKPTGIQNDHTLLYHLLNSESIEDTERAVKQLKYIMVDLLGLEQYKDAKIWDRILAEAYRNPEGIAGQLEQRLSQYFGLQRGKVQGSEDTYKPLTTFMWRGDDERLDGVDRYNIAWFVSQFFRVRKDPQPVDELHSQLAVLSSGLSSTMDEASRSLVTSDPFSLRNHVRAPGGSTENGYRLGDTASMIMREFVNEEAAEGRNVVVASLSGITNPTFGENKGVQKMSTNDAAEMRTRLWENQRVLFVPIMVGDHQYVRGLAWQLNAEEVAMVETLSAKQQKDFFNGHYTRIQSELHSRMFGRHILNDKGEQDSKKLKDAVKRSSQMVSQMLRAIITKDGAGAVYVVEFQDMFQAALGSSTLSPESKAWLMSEPVREYLKEAFADGALHTNLQGLTDLSHSWGLLPGEELDAVKFLVSAPELIIKMHGTMLSQTDNPNPVEATINRIIQETAENMQEVHKLGFLPTVLVVSQEGTKYLPGTTAVVNIAEGKTVAPMEALEIPVSSLGFMADKTHHSSQAEFARMMPILVAAGFRPTGTYASPEALYSAAEEQLGFGYDAVSNRRFKTNQIYLGEMAIVLKDAGVGAEIRTLLNAGTRSLSDTLKATPEYKKFDEALYRKKDENDPEFHKNKEEDLYAALLAFNEMLEEQGDTLGDLGTTETIVAEQEDKYDSVMAELDQLDQLRKDLKIKESQVLSPDATSLSQETPNIAILDVQNVLFSSQNDATQKASDLLDGLSSAELLKKRLAGALAEYKATPDGETANDAFVEYLKD